MPQAVMLRYWDVTKKDLDIKPKSLTEKKLKNYL